MLTTKKREEELVTAMLLQRINERYGTHYEAHAVPSELVRIDTRGISHAPGEPHIDFQVTYADNGLPHEGGSVLGRRFRTPNTNIIDLTTPYDVAAAIARKQDRYGKDEASRLVLVVWKNKTCLIEPAGLDWNEDSIWFKGCYFVCLPGGGTPGQVLTLKPMQAEDGTLYDL